MYRKICRFTTPAQVSGISILGYPCKEISISHNSSVQEILTLSWREGWCHNPVLCQIPPLQCQQIFTLHIIINPGNFDWLAWKPQVEGLCHPIAFASPQVYAARARLDTSNAEGDSTTRAHRSRMRSTGHVAASRHKGAVLRTRQNTITRSFLYR